MTSQIEHLTDEELCALFDENLPRLQLAEGLLHLAVCDACRQRFRTAYPQSWASRFRRWFGMSTLPETRNLTASTVDLALSWGSKQIQAAIRELDEAERLWREVADLDRARLRLLVSNTSRYSTLGFAVLLLAMASRTWLNDPEDAYALADLGLSVLQSLDTEARDRRRVHDVTARAFTYRANCSRILGNFTEALQDFQHARLSLAAGTGDPIELANTLNFQGSFLRDRRLISEARRALRTAAILYRDAGDTESEAKMIVQEALVLREAGQPIVGVRTLEGLANQYTEHEMGSDNFYRCQYNLVLLAIDADMLDKARELLPRVRHLVRQKNNRFDLIRLEWLEALLHDKAGQDEQAEEKYSRVQEFFLQEGIGYDAAFVSLDLAAFYLDRDRYPEARKLAADLTPIFLADDIHREAVASLLLFQEAIDCREATVAMAKATAKALREMQTRPRRSSGSIH